jgi:methylglyoxal/glyoxal reductase
LYLLHYPGCSESLCKESPAGTWKEAWKALEKIYHDKQARAIGVSNFSLEQIKQLIKFTKVKPHVVQNWFDPLHQDWDTVNFCRSHNIAYQAYSPLGTQHQKTPNPVLTHPTILALAEKHGRTPAQVVLRWMVQEGIPTIPRTNSNAHLKENSEIIHFALPRSDMQKIRDIKP